MATNRNITLKRGNGTDFDVLFPTTHMGQIQVSDSDTTSISTYLTNTYVPLTQKAAANGVATLDANTKIPLAQLPDAVFDSLFFAGTISAASSSSILAAAFAEDIAQADSWGRSYLGFYYVVSTTGTIAAFSGVLDAVTGKYVTVSFDIGDGATAGTGSGAMEVGDWFVVNNFSGTGTSGDPYVIYLSVINNVYETGTTARYGIVQLSNATTTADTGTDVITESVLNGLIGTTSGKIAAGDHNHNGTYQAADADLTTIAGLAATDGNFIVGNGTTWTVESGSTARTSLGLGSLATLSTINNDIWSGTDLSIANGGTGASDATAARANLGLTIGTHVQAYNEVLDTFIGLANTDGNFIVGNGLTWVVESGATARTSLGVYSTTQVDNFFTNRPEIFYDTTAGAGLGDIIIDLD